MMKRKAWEDSREQMLAMATIPLCSWDQKEEKTSNPEGARRHAVLPNEAKIDLESRKHLTILGKGGDFAGFIVRSHRTARKFGIPEGRELLPNYEFVDLRFDINLNNADISMKPPPREDLDYDFSESAKFFFDNGVCITLPENSVTLTSGKRKPAVMNGTSVLLIGHHDEEDSYGNLLSRIWLWALALRMGDL